MDDARFVIEHHKRSLTTRKWVVVDRSRIIKGFGYGMVSQHGSEQHALRGVAEACKKALKAGESVRLEEVD